MRWGKDKTKVMKIENQVCTLEQAMKLKELGVVSQSYLCHAHLVEKVHKGFDGEVTEYMAEYNDGTEIIPTSAAIWDDIPHYSAFTVAELGEMLPTGYDTMKLTNWKNGFVWGGYDDSDSPCPSEKTYLSEAEARAAMLIHLIESKLMTVEEINNRLK